MPAIKMMLVVATTAAITAQAQIEADKVTELPGVGPLTSNHWSGYLTLDGKDPKNMLGQFTDADTKTYHMHYYFVESLNDPANDPVVVWLNGGPACSAMGGLWGEMGPYLMTQFGEFVNNTYTWAQSSNMLFIESPVGVGFSYASPLGDLGLLIGDDITSMLNYQTMRHFFEAYPKFLGNGRKLHLFGESYAGHYIPTLADRVLELAIKNPASSTDAAIGSMMTGFAVGNPCTGAPKNNPTGDPDADFCYQREADWTLKEFFRSHAYGLEYGGDDENYDSLILGIDGMDPYDILAPSCALPSALFERKVREEVPHMTVDQVRRAARYAATPEVGKKIAADDVMGAINPYGPCNLNYITTYLNRADVKAAMHVKSDIDWSVCNQIMNGLWDHRRTSKGNVQGVMDYYRKFFNDTHVKANWTIVMYSGDADSVVNFVQSQTVVQNMAGNKQSSMKPWYMRDTYNSSNTQLGGWYQDFEHMQWASVKGCGHMVPGYCPYKAYGMFESIIKTGKVGAKPHTFASSTLAPGLIPANECPNYKLPQ